MINLKSSKFYNIHKAKVWGDVFYGWSLSIKSLIHSRVLELMGTYATLFSCPLLSSKSDSPVIKILERHSLKLKQIRALGWKEVHKCWNYLLQNLYFRDSKTLTETLVSFSAFVPKNISKIWKEKSRLRDRDYLHRGAPDRSRLYHT